MDLSEWWGEHGETVWATIAALIIAVAVGYYFWRKAEKLKHLGWQRINATRIIRGLPDSERNKIKLVYNESEVKDPNILMYRIGNSGKKEILISDFDGNLNIDFESRLLAYDVVGKSNKLIEPMFIVSSSAPNRVSLKPLLLNPGDWLDLQFVTDGELADPLVTARVAGETSSIADVTDSGQITPMTRWILIGIGSLAVTIGIIWIIRDGLDNFVANLPSILAAVLVVTGLTAYRRKPIDRLPVEYRVWKKRDS